MIRKELIDAIQAKMTESVSKSLVDEFLSATVEVIEETVASGNKIKIVGFGSWEKKFVKGRTGISQMGTTKGQKWETSDSFKPVFSPGKEFENKVNQ